MLLAAADTRPAGGAAIGEVIIASIIGLGLTVLVLGLVWLHRSGRSQILTRAASSSTVNCSSTSSRGRSDSSGVLTTTSLSS